MKEHLILQCILLITVGDAQVSLESNDTLHQCWPVTQNRHFSVKLKKKKDQKFQKTHG